MFKSYLISGLRNLSRRKLFSLLNIIGLALGIACFILSYYHIRYEFSYDQFYSKSSRIFRLVTGNVATGEGWVRVSAPLPAKLEADIPEIQSFVRLINLDKSSKTAVRYDQKTFYEKNFFLADPSSVDFFDLNFVVGHPSVLRDIHTIVVSRSKAEQIFGFHDPVGKTLRINDQFEFTVGGVYEDFLPNSHLDMDFIVPFANLEKLLPGTSLGSNWGQYNYFAYVLLHPDAEEGLVEQKIGDIEVRLNDDQVFSLEAINLQPIGDIHFQENRGNLKPSYDRRSALIYGFSALAILIISMINYINLSTAGATGRLKEVGLRKTIGANRRQLIAQFIGESTLITMLASIAGLLLINFLLLDWVNGLFETYLEFHLLDIRLWMVLIGLIVSISLSAGAYIAYFILRVQPVKALKGGIKTASGRSPVRSFLLVTQFIIAITLLASALFIRSQMNLMSSQDIGLEKTGVINVPLYERSWKKDLAPIKEELTGLSFVSAASGTGFQAGSTNWHQTVWWEGQQQDASMNIISGDGDLFRTLGLELISGDETYIRNASRTERLYLLNEAAVNLIGWEDGLGKSFSPFGASRKQPIAGVIKDFNYKSLHHPIEPCVLVLGNTFEPDQLLIKIQSENIGNALTGIREKFTEISPNVPFEYSFLDEDFAQLYREERRSQTVVIFYTSVAIILSILGLFGILSFELQERRKEMAVRKILGISDFGLGALVSGKFIRMLLLAGLVSIPLTWYVVEQWLMNFSYRIELGFGVFSLAIFIVFLLIMTIMALKLWELNRSNMAQVLKYE